MCSSDLNRHLLTCLRYVLKATCLVGARAITFNPHFSYFNSPDSSDSVLGSSMGWPAESALLLLDSFMPLQREAITQQACDHTHEVWIVRLDRPSNNAIADMQLIRGNRASLVAVIPPNSLVLHAPSCWSDAKWDAAAIIPKMWLSSVAVFPDVLVVYHDPKFTSAASQALVKSMGSSLIVSSAQEHQSQGAAGQRRHCQ